VELLSHLICGFIREFKTIVFVIADMTIIVNLSANKVILHMWDTTVSSCAYLRL